MNMWIRMYIYNYLSFSSWSGQEHISIPSYQVISLGMFKFRQKKNYYKFMFDFTSCVKKKKKKKKKKSIKNEAVFTKTEMNYE